jgi:hypothetical protein
MDIACHQVREAAAFGLVTEPVCFDESEIGDVGLGYWMLFRARAAPSAEPARIQAQPWGGF